MAVTRMANAGHERRVELSFAPSKFVIPSSLGISSFVILFSSFFRRLADEIQQAGIKDIGCGGIDELQYGLLVL